MKKILDHFENNDPLLYAFFLKIGKIEPIEKDKPENYFHRLCKEIVCQQLSDKSGGAIFSRFQKLFPNGLAHPLMVLSTDHDKLRATGMSHAKARYVRNLAEKIVKGELVFSNFDLLTNEQVILELTQVKGIGPWTAEMFLMFTLGREDVFSQGDLGLKKGLMKVYGFKKEPKTKQIEKIITKWTPYKSYASRILWASLEL